MAARQRQGVPASALGRRRNLRKAATKPEQLLWAVLRKRINGTKFRRQHSIGPFIADFACTELQLVIELDGGYHDYTAEQDQRRQDYLEQQGFQVLRFWNQDVLEDLEAVVVAVTNAIAQRLERRPEDERPEN